MRIQALMERLRDEEAKTDYGRGLLWYGKEMVRRKMQNGFKGSLPPSFSPFEEVMLDGAKDWEELSHRVDWRDDGECIALRLGLQGILDYRRSDMLKVQGQAMREAFGLLWAEVSAMSKLESTYMIRRVWEGKGKELAGLGNTAKGPRSSK